jgi:hypothetical protein
MQTGWPMHAPLDGAIMAAVSIGIVVSLVVVTAVMVGAFVAYRRVIRSMRVEPDADGTPSRWLQTQPDDSFVAKDRSGALDPFEKPDLAAIAAKVRNPNAN